MGRPGVKLSWPKWLVKLEQWPAAIEARVAAAESEIACQPGPIAAPIPTPPIPASVVAPPSVAIPLPQGKPTMNFANFFRSAAGVVWADVEKVFTEATAAVTASPLPATIKTGLTSTLSATQTEMSSVAALAETAAGSVVADGIDDVTTLLVNTAGVVSSGKKLADMSAAELALLKQTWTAMKAQGETLLAQLQAGLDPTAVKPAV